MEGGSPKRPLLVEGSDQDIMSPFFRLLTILPYRVPNTPKEFAAHIAAKDLNFVWGLSVTGRWSLFVYASRTLFRARSLVSIVAYG